MLLLESLLDVRTKNASNLTDEEWVNLMQYDPLISTINDLTIESMNDTPESYSRWLVKMNKANQLANRDPNEIKQLLTNFTKLKNKRNVLPSNDINHYQTIDELIVTINDNINKMSVRQQNRQAHKDKKNIENADKPGKYLDDSVELLFNGSNWQVWTPLTFQGSKALRRGAVWCTGGDDPYYYNSYTQEGQLFEIINKQDPKEKYQLFVPFADYDARHEVEFKDKNNNTIRFREFVHDNKELLDFFMTQDNVTNAYEDLDDPDKIDDEWSEDKEFDVMQEYDLSYNDWTGEIVIMIDYSDLIKETFYTNDEDYKSLCSKGYIESYSEDFAKEVIQSEHFIDDVDWENTVLMDLYNYFIFTSGESEEEIDFKDFLKTLFDTFDYENNKIVEDWFKEHNKTNDDWRDAVFNCITEYELCRPINDFVYNACTKLGWDESQFRKNRTYGEYFENAFMYVIEDCHSIQEFYNDYADEGHKSYYDVINDLITPIDESEGVISTDEVDFYEDYDDYTYDAKQIVDIFMTNQEWNDFLKNDED